jgi:acyl dehydratase
MTTTPVQDDAPLKAVLFENIEVGEQLGPIEIDVDEFLMRQHEFTVEELPPTTTDAEGQIAQASILLGEMLRLLNTRYDPHHDVGLHQREQVWFHSPVRAGERVRLTGTMVEKYERRDRGYFVIEAEARVVGSNRLICRHRPVEAILIGDPDKLGGGRGKGTAERRVEGHYPLDVPVVDTASADVAIGSPLPVLERTVHQSQISVYSNVSAFWRTTHTDVHGARAAGLDSTIAQGLMEACYISDLASRFFGVAWHTTGHMDLAFLAPYYPGDSVKVLAVVSGLEEAAGGTRVELEVWVEDAQTGRKLTVGWVDAVVPEDAS